MIVFKPLKTGFLNLVSNDLEILLYLKRSIIYLLGTNFLSFHIIANIGQSLIEYKIQRLFCYK